jgi:hypothetical protein
VKRLLISFFVLASFSCFAENSLVRSSVQWIADVLPDDTSFDLASAGLGFKGCKQRDYQMRISQPLTASFSMDTSLGYSKGKLQWGVFSQKVSVYEVSIVPRYQVSERLSFGLGVIAQSEVKFTTSQGLAFDLPRNTEWLASSRIQGSAPGHYWEVMVSSQKWQTSQNAGSWFERGTANNKLTLLYNGSF